MTDREAAAAESRALLENPATVILDCETTGLGGGAEICSVAIVSTRDQVLLDTFVRPSLLIPAAATQIHGITDAMVAGAPTFDQIAPRLREILAGSTCVIYNARYDTRLLEQSARACGLAYEIPIFGADYKCAMELYSAWIGDWNHRYGDYRWQALPAGAHSALGDCRACLAVLRRMAGLTP